MTRTLNASRTASRLLAGATLACAAALAAAATPPADHPPTSPDQPHPRRGDYAIEDAGTGVIYAKCAEGGRVFVSAHPRGAAASAPAGRIAPERDAEIREACMAVDYTK